MQVVSFVLVILAGLNMLLLLKLLGEKGVVRQPIAGLWCICTVVIFGGLLVCSKLHGDKIYDLETDLMQHDESEDFGIIIEDIPDSPFKKVIRQE